MLAFDQAKARDAKSAFKRAARLEQAYSARLRSIARHIADIVRMFDLSTYGGASRLERALRDYAAVLEPWARAVGEKMVQEVAAADTTAWRRRGADMGRALHQEIEHAPTGQAMRDAMARQVTLIRSIPEEAANRVHQLTIEGISQGKRADEIADDIQAIAGVSRSRAMLIAVTEIARTATELTKARAEYVGSHSYIWRSMGDAAVRRDHRALNGTVQRWDAPPIADRRTGARAHPGCIYRCRCYPEPLIPD